MGQNKEKERGGHYRCQYGVWGGYGDIARVSGSINL